MSTKETKWQSRESGFSSAAALLMTGAVGIFAMIWTQRDTSQMKLAAHESIATDTKAIQQTLSHVIDCTQTTSGVTPATQCNGTTAIPLKRADGSLIASGNSLGNYQVSSTCKQAVDSSGVGLGTYYMNIKVQRVSGGTVINDPLTGKALDYSAPSMQLFGQSYGLCATSLGGGGGGGAAASTSAVIVTTPLVRVGVNPTQARGTNGLPANNGSAGYGSGSCVLGSLRSNDWTTNPPNLGTSGMSLTYFEYDAFDNGSGGDESRAVWGDKFVGTATCPIGYLPIGGGADCKSLGGYSFLRNGVQTGSAPTANGWLTGCCGRANGIAVGSAHPTATAFVVCLPQNGP